MEPYNLNDALSFALFIPFPFFSAFLFTPRCKELCLVTVIMGLLQLILHLSNLACAPGIVHLASEFVTCLTIHLCLLALENWIGWLLRPRDYILL